MRLYTLQWYKGSDEFYRFIPGDSPAVQLFDVPGAHVDKQQSTASSVILLTLELSSSGKYRCEVSAEAPFFRTVSDSGYMRTVPLTVQVIETGKSPTANERGGFIENLTNNFVEHIHKPNIFKSVLYVLFIVSSLLSLFLLLCSHYIMPCYF